MQNLYFVYILSNANRTIYIGVTNNLERRIAQHKLGEFEGFTKKYSVHLLVYYEWFSDIQEAIRREKQLKKWNRAWKLELIEKKNPQWVDLSLTGYQFPV